ncbi:MAG: undecaprenyl-diphosphate phosphatase [Halobacteriovoraceae bacterium]|nr:undecaprenyl-diphosphate phosphatase [Halobacteriovoraceae bacterium]
MNYIDATLYGLIQGFSEFLPISSSGHLALLPHLLGIQNPGILFDFGMHIGTFLSILLYFRKDLTSEIQTLLTNKRPSPLALYLILSTIASVAFILIFKDYAEVYRSTKVISFNLIFFGILLGLTDLSAKKFQAPEKGLSPIKSILIGIAQGIAIFPGVSRSGATISLGRFFKLNRTSASRYSFLLAIPIMFAGIIYKIPEMYQGNFEQFSYGTLSWGGFVAFASGWATIHFFLKLIGKTPLYLFSIYRIILGVLILFL